MKSIQLINLTFSGTFLFSQNNSHKEGSFEGLSFNTSMLSRYIIKPYFSKPIQCSLSKNNNKIRYANIEFFQEMLKLNIAKLNPLQFEQSKLFTSQQKVLLKKAASQINTEKLIQIGKSIKDYTADRKSLQTLYSQGKIISGCIECLSNQIIIRYESDGKCNYVPLRLKHIDHYFQLIDKVSYSKFIKSVGQIAIKFVSFSYNLARKQYQIEAELPQAVQNEILNEGWGTVSLKNIMYIKPRLFAEFRKKQQEAKASHKGIFAKPFEILSLVYTKNNLVAVVQQIIQGYIFKIRAKNDEVIKIELAKIYCPIQNEPGAFTCRQFARKNLIGRQVNVFLTKDQGLNILGSIVRFGDNKDIQTLMIQNGFGFVKDQLKGTMFYAKLQTLQRKAKDSKKGIHNEKSIGIQFYEDFTASNNKKQKIQKKNIIEDKERYLQQIQAGEEGVIDKCIDVVNYVVRIDSHKKIIKVKLDGVTKLLANPRLPEIKDLQKNCQIYCYRNFYQRTVSLELTEYNQNLNSYIGILRPTIKGKQKLSLQQILISQGLVTLSTYGFFQQKWLQFEKQAEKQQLNCWNPKLRQFIRKDIFDEQNKEFMGKFSWIQDGELAYVQPNSAIDKLDYIYESLQNKEGLKTVAAQDLVPGFLCAAEYMQELCRSRIISINDKKTAIVKFIDWGNKQTVPISSLKQLPQDLQYIPPLCCEVLLDIVRPMKTKNADHLQKLREFLLQSECKFVKSYANVVNVYREGEHLNTSLVYEGFVKADLTKVHGEASKNHISQQMNRLRKQLVGIWDLQDNDSDIEQDD